MTDTLYVNIDKRDGGFRSNISSDTTELGAMSCESMSTMEVTVTFHRRDQGNMGHKPYFQLRFGPEIPCVATYSRQIRGIETRGIKWQHSPTTFQVTKDDEANCLVFQSTFSTIRLPITKEDKNGRMIFDHRLPLSQEELQVTTFERHPDARTTYAPKTQDAPFVE